jgi:hypothetical protein
MMTPAKVIEVPGQPHTFGLATARSMLRKLEWEVAEVERQDPFTAFRAFNTAVTAWHLVDWVWSDLARSSNGRGGKAQRAFQDRCRTACPGLKLCEAITNASKHSGSDRGERAGSCTTLIADVVYAKCGAAVCGEPLSTWTWRLIIRDGEHEYAAADVFDRILVFWRALIERELPKAILA